MFNNKLLLTIASKTYLVFQETLRSNDFFKDVFADMCIYSTQWVIQEIGIWVTVHSSTQTDTLLLTSTQVDTLVWKHALFNFSEM